MCNLDLGDYDSAVNDATSTIEQGSNESYLWMLRAAAYTKIGKLDLALSDFDTVVRLEPTPKAYVGRGLLLFKLGKYER